jgi:type II secretory ATPase GspE/PulE/Tfp pilus assembly ATPase PilB-like protein/CheY-like chemotaxis protein
MITGTIRQHWLVALVQPSEHATGQQIAVDTQAPVGEAWTEVCRACRLTEQELAARVARHFKLPLADLNGGESRVLKLVPEAVARRYGIFPLREDDRHLVVATSNPMDLDVEQALGFVSSRTPVFEVAPPAAIREAIDAQYSPDRVVAALLGSVGPGFADAVRVLEETGPATVSSAELDAAPVVKLCSLILQKGVSERASDIHVEPGRAGGVVRFRVDGVLHQFMQLPMMAMARVVSRIKIMAKLDIADRMRPQDGRARIQVHEKVYDLRVSTVPTREAEKAVIRILDPGAAQRLDDMGMGTEELSRFRRLLAFREGLVVVTGPTGSGKTTTLYAALRELMTGKINIMTVEDPVEYELGGITQMQVETKRGVTFASSLRAILRQDPDVVFVGEIRDLETAEVAVQAAMTGHLVLATLHTNDAVGVIPRLIDLGLSAKSLAAALRGIVAQRLVRRVCEHCHTIISGELTPEEARLSRRDGVRPAVRAGECPRCGQTGFRGRIAVMDVVLSTPDLQEVIARAGTAAELLHAAVAGGARSMRASALAVVAAGVTTLEEVERVLGEATDEKATPAVEGPHALLVDDDGVVRTLARGLLEKSGLRVSEVGDGRSAIDRLAVDPDFSLIVLDLNMPVLGGIEVLRHVRKTASMAGVPVVVLTSSEDHASEVLVMDAGADDYIRKPIDPSRFIARIKAALRRAGAPAY